MTRPPEYFSSDEEAKRYFEEIFLGIDNPHNPKHLVIFLDEEGNYVMNLTKTQAMILAQKIMEIAQLLS